MAEVNPVGFLSAAPPFDPAAMATKFETLDNLRRTGQGQDIANDTNQTALQVQKLNNMRTEILQHLGNPNATKDDLIRSIDDGVKAGKYTLQAAAIGKDNISRLPDDPASIHRYLLNQDSTLLDAHQRLLASTPGVGPDYNQGAYIQPTNRGALLGDTPNALTPNGRRIEIGRTPAEMMQPTTIQVKGPDGVWRTQPVTQGQAGQIINPAGANRFDNPAPMGTNPLGSPAPVGQPSSPAPQSSASPTTFAPGALFAGKNLLPGVTADEDAAARTILMEAGNQGVDGQRGVAATIVNRENGAGVGAQAIVSSPSQFEPVNKAATRAQGEAIDPGSPAYQQALTIYRDQKSGKSPDPTGGATHFVNPTIMAQRGGMPTWTNGQAPSAVIGAHHFYKIGYSGASGSPPPQGGGNSQTNPALSQPTTLAADTEAGQKAKTADQLLINNNTEYDGQKQARWTVMNLLHDPRVWTGGGQSIIKNLYDKFALVGGDQSPSARLDAVAHALQKSTGMSLTDAGNRLNAIANGSGETAKAALIDLVRQTHAGFLANEARARLNVDTPAQDYTKAPNIDPRAIELSLQPSQEARRAYIKNLHLKTNEADVLLQTEKELHDKVPSIFRNTGTPITP